ncbi:MAG: glycerol-3-phosphate 1-O-acyltransferase PlsY [Candidatus Lariskella arthropodorum]|uniref:glycerol-3-phosphate 1-O-acyltransferase PlsY n=2 Tax=unclassified Candidatus Lariskella TaxID=2632605 RepID=UPI0030CB266D
MSLSIMLAILITYLIAGIPFGLLFAKLLGHKDLRAHGSGNIGATNAMRVGGKKLGILTLIADATKGAIPVLIAKQYDYNLAICVGLSAILGHIFSIWLRFKGGKGIATSIAVILSLDIYVGVFTCIFWLITFLIFQTSAIASLISMIAMLLGTIFIIQSKYDILFGLIVCLLVFYRHKENIKNILWS